MGLNCNHHLAPFKHHLISVTFSAADSHSIFPMGWTRCLNEPLALSTLLLNWSLSCFGQLGFCGNLKNLCFMAFDCWTEECPCWDFYETMLGIQQGHAFCALRTLICLFKEYWLCFFFFFSLFNEWNILDLNRVLLQCLACLKLCLAWFNCCSSSWCIAKFEVSICLNLRIGRDVDVRFCSQSHFIDHFYVLPQVRGILFHFIMLLSSF